MGLKKQWGEHLELQDTDMKWKYVAYFSCKMLPAGQNYGIYDAELLIVVEVFKT